MFVAFFPHEVWRMKPMAAVAKWIPIVMVVFSLVSVYAFSQIDTIVHGTLYSYGLQFSYDWATHIGPLLDCYGDGLADCGVGLFFKYISWDGKHQSAVNSLNRLEQKTMTVGARLDSAMVLRLKLSWL